MRASRSEMRRAICICAASELETLDEAAVAEEGVGEVARSGSGERGGERGGECSGERGGERGGEEEEAAAPLVEAEALEKLKTLLAEADGCS